jgi:hypothetical protein
MPKNAQQRKLNKAGRLRTHTALVRSSQPSVDACVITYPSPVVVGTARYDWHAAIGRQQLLMTRYRSQGVLVPV